MPKISKAFRTKENDPYPRFQALSLEYDCFSIVPAGKDRQRKFFDS